MAITSFCHTIAAIFKRFKPSLSKLFYGKKIDAPKPLKKRIKKYRKLSKSLSKKTRGTKRYEKARLRIAKFHGKLKDTRDNFLHKLSTEIIRENQTIILEDLFAKHSEGNVSPNG